MHQRRRSAGVLRVRIEARAQQALDCGGVGAPDGVEQRVAVGGGRDQREERDEGEEEPERRRHGWPPFRLVWRPILHPGVPPRGSGADS
jgi:hypothetical protein